MLQGHRDLPPECREGEAGAPPLHFQVPPCRALASLLDVLKLRQVQ